MFFRSDRCGIVTRCCTVNQWTKTNCSWCTSRLFLHAPPLCPPGERQPVSRSQRGAPEAACTSLQLPGGGGSHQPGHDPRHTGHEPAKGWCSAAALVRINMINRCLMTFCCLVGQRWCLGLFCSVAPDSVEARPVFQVIQTLINKLPNGQQLLEEVKHKDKLILCFFSFPVNFFAFVILMSLLATVHIRYFSPTNHEWSCCTCLQSHNNCCKVRTMIQNWNYYSKVVLIFWMLLKLTFTFHCFTRLN